MFPFFICEKKTEPALTQSKPMKSDRISIKPMWDTRMPDSQPRLMDDQ